MEYRRLGGSSVEVSQIGLGTWGMSGAFWGAADDAESIRVIHRALELGVTLIDTAEAYGKGHAEEVVGKALAGRRDRAVIATKVMASRLDPQELQAALEGSLRRLQTDYVEVYFIHWPNPDFPIGPTMEALERLRADGRIRAIGVSNFGPRRWIGRANTARSMCCSRPTTCCGGRSKRRHCPYCRKHNIGVMPYSGLAQGLADRHAVARHRVRGGR